jgi:hypothetical protein
MKFCYVVIRNGRYAGDEGITVIEQERESYHVTGTEGG